MKTFKNSQSTMSANSDTLSFKLLGFLGDKLIISSLDNKKILVLNQADYPHIEIIKKEGDDK